VLGHRPHNRAPGEQPLLVDNRVALGAGHHQRLAVADLDGQGRITPRLDQQARRGFVLGRQQESPQQNDHQRRNGGQFELVAKDEEQA